MSSYAMLLLDGVVVPATAYVATALCAAAGSFLGATILVPMRRQPRR